LGHRKKRLAFLSIGSNTKETIGSGDHLHMQQTSYNQGYQDGFQHGFLTAIIGMNSKKDQEKHWEHDFLLQKKKAREWAISKGYLKIKK